MVNHFSLMIYGKPNTPFTFILMRRVQLVSVQSLVVIGCTVFGPRCGNPPGGGVLPYMGYIGTCRRIGYGF